MQDVINNLVSAMFIQHFHADVNTAAARISTDVNAAPQTATGLTEDAGLPAFTLLGPGNRYSVMKFHG